MGFKEKWHAAVARKNSLLCVGIDPADDGQRRANTLARGEDKLAFCLSVIEKVSPYAAAIKPNRQYIRDFSRKEMLALTSKIHELGMVAIDDSKIADIGDTNDAAFYHSKAEGYDAITYAPFPGNIAAAAEAAQKRDLGLITLVLMSNPEFLVMKNAKIEGQKGSFYFAGEVKRAQGEGIVLGAPSEKNHITDADMEGIKEILDDQLILVPGIGAQGGSAKSLIEAFGSRIIANVGRDIFYAKDPAKVAKSYQQILIPS